MKKVKIFTGEKNEILRKTSEEVKIPEAKKIISKMRIAINQQPALGIAAPQIGINKRIILVKIGKSFMTMVNPEIISMSNEKNIAEEGCLSLPEIWGNVERSTKITIKFADEKNSKKKLILKDLDARIAQHEVDHLNGILFTDKLLHGVVM